MTKSDGWRRAVLIAGVAYAAFIALHLALAWDGGRILTTRLPKIGPWLGPADWAIYSLFAIVLALRLGWPKTGITRRPLKGWLRASLVPISASLPFFLLGFNIDSSDIPPLLLVGVPLIALNEELVYRGVFLPLLQPLGLRKAVIGSAVLFGFAHLPNVVAGASVPFTAMQVAATVAGGVALAALRIRYDSLWPPLLVHAAIDTIAITTLTGPALGNPLLIPTLFVWLIANLALWRYGWRVLASHPVEEPPKPGATEQAFA
jgi:membrane protease YdiL (CAAX protease family)